MGNWENTYYEIHDEVTSLGVREQFNTLVEQLSNSKKFKHQSVRRRWMEALKIIRENEQ